MYALPTVGQHGTGAANTSTNTPGRGWDRHARTRQEPRQRLACVQVPGGKTKERDRVSLLSEALLKAERPCGLSVLASSLRENAQRGHTE